MRGLFMLINITKEKKKKNKVQTILYLTKVVRDLAEEVKGLKKQKLN